MKKYKIRNDIPASIEKNLSKYSPIIQKLLYHRGVLNEEQAERLFNPNYERDTHDPMLLLGMERGVKRILRAIENNEKILIYSDYDADGIPGGVILHDFFRKIQYKNFSNYIPHRNDEGFGLNMDAVRAFKKDNVDLIITVDCGITDVEPVAEAKKLGMDVIITDHHLQGKELPDAHTIINPNQRGDKYPCKFLCGSAVAFKLVQALIKLGNFNIVSGWEKWLLDMVGLATISDMVSLTGENRTLSYYGLLVLRKTQRLGLKNLYKETKVNTKNLNEDDLAFVITPRINAASRMDEVQTAFDVLKETDVLYAEEGAKRLTKLNNERKILTATIVKDIKRKISKKGELPDVIVFGNPKWKPSILGLVAGNIAEEFNRPVFLWGRNGGGEIRGSCRSDQKVSVYEMMASLPEGFLDHFGGHKHSGGFGISNGNVHFLEEKLLRAYKVNGEEKKEETVLLDGNLSLADVSWNLARELERLAPFGVGNPKPLFIFKGVELPEVQSFGKHSEHLKLDFPNGKGKSLSAIKFFAGTESFEKPLNQGQKVELIATIEKSYFRNTPELRLRIVDIL